MKVISNPEKRKSIKCACCDGIIVKTQAEIDIYKKEGNQHFCSLACIDKYNTQLILKHKKECQKFEYILSTIDKPGKGVDVLYLNTLWEEQNGKCDYTKIGMLLPGNESDLKNSMISAKIEKINKSRGFIKSNIKFVCSGISYIEERYSKEEVTKFIGLIKTNL